MVDLNNLSVSHTFIFEKIGAVEASRVLEKFNPFIDRKSSTSLVFQI